MIYYSRVSFLMKFSLSKTFIQRTNERNLHSPVIRQLYLRTICLFQLMWYEKKVWVVSLPRTRPTPMPKISRNCSPRVYYVCKTRSEANESTTASGVRNRFSLLSCVIMLMYILWYLKMLIDNISAIHNLRLSSFVFVYQWSIVCPT